MTDHACLEALEITHLRALEAQAVRFGPGAHLIVGANGAGKSSLLEAISLIGNLRSFRTPRIRALIPKGQGCVRLRALLREKDAHRPIELELELEPGRRELRCDEQVERAESWLRRYPVLSIAPADRELVLGEPDRRRSFLDYSCFLLDPEIIAVQRRYRQLLAQRNAALGGSSQVAEIAAWEAHLAVAAAAMIDARRALVTRLQPLLDSRLTQLSDGALAVQLNYREDRASKQAETPLELEKSLLERYTEGRGRDRDLGFTTYGPHRHDLMINSGSTNARELFSAGQLRLLLAAIRLAQIELFRSVEKRVALVVDDVDVELDAPNLSRLLAAIRESGQVFVSSARPESLEALAGKARIFEIVAGKVEAREKL